MSDTSMVTSFDAISASLGAATPVATIPRPESKALTEVKESPEVEDDYQEARSNLKELISQMMEQVPELISITQQAQSDKMYNAAAAFINAAANLNISLSKLSKEIKRVPSKNIANPEQGPVQNIQNNNVFVGSTEDFLNMMEDRKRKAQLIEGEFVEVDKET